MLCFQLCFAHYTPLQMKNSMRSVSAINSVALENQAVSQHSQREATLCYHKSTPCINRKKNWNTKEDRGK